MFRVITSLLILTSLALAIEVPLLNESPEIDGLLDEPVWESACIMSEFYQQYPKSGEIPTNPSEVRIFQDEKNLYFGVTFQGDTSRLYRNQNRRDANVHNDDSIEIFISTMGKESAYWFVVNSINIQADGIYLANTNYFDKKWDGVWESATNTEDDHWTLEIAIPFRTLRYGRENTWYFDIVRFDKVAKETSCLYSYNSYITNTENFGELTGLILPHAMTVDVIPYGMLNRVGEDTDGSLTYELEKKGGVDFQTTIGGNLTINSTLNPDYAHIESDPEEIHITPEEILYPEKRPFFQEGTDEFNLPNGLFYSRRITDIWIGTKAIGRFRSTSFGLMHCYLKDDDPLFPKANIIVGRTRVNISDALLLGGSYTGIMNDDGYNHVVSGDSDITLPKGIDLQLGYAGSFSEGLSTDESKTLVKERQIGWLTSATLIYQTTHGGHWWTFLASSADFNAPLSQIQYYSLGVYGLSGGGEHIWGFSDSIVKETYLAYYWVYDRNITDNELSAKAGYNLKIEFPNVWGLWTGGEIARDAYLSDDTGDIYDVRWMCWDVYALPRPWFGGQLGCEYGSGWGYDRYFSLYTRLAVSPVGGLDISFGPSIAYPEGEEKMWVYRLSANQTINQWFYWRFTHDGSYDGIYKFAWLVGINYQPGSTIYVAYQEMREDTDNGFVPLERVIFLKGSYDLRL